jgi:gliding motility-associated-like protein
MKKWGVAWIIWGILLSATSITAQSQSQTFYSNVPTTLGELTNKIAADPTDGDAFYTAFEVRKLQGAFDVYTLLARYNCEGGVDWKLGLETNDPNERLVDMAVLNNGRIGILQSRGQDEFYLHWVGPNGDLLRSYQIELGRTSEAWALEASPSGNTLMIVFAHDTGGADEIGFLEVDFNGQQIREETAGPYDDDAIVHWAEADRIALKTGKELRVFDLSRNTLNWIFLPDALMGDGAIYMEGDDVYLAYVTANDGEANFLKYTNFQLQWHRSYTYNTNFQYVRLERTAEGFDMLLETGFNGAEIIFASVDEAGNPVDAYVLDAAVESFLGEFALDLNGNWLYSGSSLPNGNDDIIARLNPMNDCVLPVSLNAGSVSSPIGQEQTGTVIARDWAVTSVPEVTYSAFPPEDIMCRPGAEDLSARFPDSSIVCDSVYIINHNLDESFTYNGDPVPNPWRITLDGSYTIEWMVCNRMFEYTFNVDFQDCSCNWFIPNIFSPNGDNINDLFLPEGECYHSDFRFQIFDRWGTQIFESESPFEAWDGTWNGRLAPTGVYTYLLTYFYLGNNTDQQEYGTVTLVR